MGDLIGPSNNDDRSILPGNGMDVANIDSTLESESSTAFMPTTIQTKHISLVRYIGLGLVGASIIATIFVYLQQTPKNQSSVDAHLTSSAEQRFNVQTIPSSDLTGLSSTSISSSPTLSINGKLWVNNSLIITPTSRPTNAVAGQVYYDKSTNQLGYYNGTSFTYLTDSQTSVTSLGGASGIIGVGVGLNQNNNQITNTGVLAVQGQTGNVTLVGSAGISISGVQFTNTGVLAIGGQVGSINLGGGLNITGGTLRNSGIVSITSGSPNLQVGNDGNGNVTLTNSGAGTGTVNSPGGTAGQIAEFTGSQTITNSLLNQSGTALTDSGSLDVTGNLTLGTPLSITYGGTGATSPAGARLNISAAASGANSDITSLSGLTTALSVLQGGTGTTSLAANGVLLGNGGSPVTSLTAGSPGLCLISAAGSPTWQLCPGGGGVVSLNSLTGTLSIANATGSGSTITINSASTSQLGLAEFNATNFTVSSGVVNTVQPIDTSATPTFGQLSLTSAQSAANMAIINNTDVSATGDLIALQLNGFNEFTVGPEGNVVANGTITSGLINGQTISNAANLTGSLAVTGTTNLNGGANVTGVLGVNTITPTGSLAVGTSGQSFTLQGNSSSTISATGGGFTTSIGFTGTPSGAVTYSFDRSAVAGIYTICTTIGNCTGVGGGVTSSGSTSGTIPVFTGTNAISSSSIADNGMAVSTTEQLDVQGSSISVGVPNVRTGTLQLSYGGANFSASLTPGGLTANRTYTLPDASGIVCLSSGNCLGGGSGGANNALSNLSGVAINTSLLPGTTTIDLGSSSAPFRNLYLAGSSGSPSTSNFTVTGTPTAVRTLTLPDATGTICLATSTACGFAAGNGMAFLQNGNSFGASANVGTNDNNSLNLITNGSARVSIDGTGNTTFNNNVTLDGSTLSSSGALTVTPGGTLTVGATGQTFILQGNSSSTITATSGVNTTTLAFVSPTANVTYRLQAAATGTYDLCTTAGNCVGLGGGVTSSGSTSGTIAVFTGSNSISNSLLSQSGGTITINGNLSLASGNQYQINGIQISSANLSNGTNLAQLNASQTFSGATNTFSSNVAINGGTLSSSGVLAITPGAALTVGATGQAFTLQGNTGSIITSTSGMNTTTLGFQTPGANVTYNLPTATTGTYSICTTTGNCAGVGGSVTTPGGTSGTIPVFTSSNGISNSLLSQSSSTVAVNGNLNLVAGNNYEINGSQIASANLSDSSNLAKLNASQTFTSTNTFQANSTNAFVIQNTSGYNIFNVDTIAGKLTLGSITSVAGQGVAGSITFADGTSDDFGIALNTTTLTTNQTITFPNASGTICLSSGNCLGGGSGGANSSLSNLTGVAINTSLLPGNTVIDLGSSTTSFRNLYLAGGSTSPSINNFSITGTATAGRIIALPDASGTICLQSSASCGFEPSVGGSGYVQLQASTPGTAQSGNFNISGSGTVGNLSVKPQTDSTTVLQVQDATTSNSVFNVDTVNNQVDIGTTTGSGTLTVQGSTTTNGASALVVTDVNGNDLLQAHDDGQIILGKISSGSGSTIIGHDNIGANADNGFNHIVLASKITTGAGTPTLNSITVYVQGPIDPSPTNKYMVGIYSDNSGNPSSLIASSSQGTLTAGAWNTLAVSASLAANTNYWLAFSTNTTSNVENYVPYDTGGTSTHAYESGYSNAGITLPSNFTVSGGSGLIDSIYATVTESGPLTTTLTLSPANGISIDTPTNTTAAFQIQNASNANVLTVDTSNGLAELGSATNLNGSLAFNNSTNANTATISSGVTSTSYILTLPTTAPSTSQCLESGATTASQLVFTNCGSGGSITLQQAYNNSAGASPNIDMTSTNKGFTIQNDNVSPISGELFGVHASTSSGLGSSLFSVANTGDTTIASSDTTGTAFSVTANSIGSGNGESDSFNGLTSGNGLKIATTSALQNGSGSLLNISDVAILTTNGGSDTGSLANVSRALTANISGTNSVPAYDNSATYHESTGVTSAWTNSYTVGSNSNRYLLAFVFESGCNLPTSVTYNGTPMTYLNYQTTLCTFAYGLAAPSSGAHNFIINPSANSKFDVQVSSWYSVNQTNSVGGFTASSGNATGTTSVSANSSIGDLVVDSMTAYSFNSTTGATTTQSGQTSLGQLNDFTGNNINVASSYRAASSSSSTTAMGWTNIGFENGPQYVWAEIAVSLNGITTSETVSSSVASISNSCALTTGYCSDSSSVLSINQQYINATGAALNIQNSGGGAALLIQDGSNNTALQVNTQDIQSDTLSSGINTAAVTFGEDANTSRSINANGSINSSGADYAEYFKQARANSLATGDLVCLNSDQTVEACNTNSNSNLIGAVSTDAGYIGNDVFNNSYPGGTALVGLLGQIKVNVSTINGPINPGDMLTISSTDGVAVKATNPGMIIGSALGSYTGSGIGQIEVYVHVIFYDPIAAGLQASNGSYLQNGSSANFSTLNVSGSTTIQELTVVGQATIATLTVTNTLTVSGHIISGGNTPTASNDLQVCTGSTAAINGTDTAGLLTITTSSACSVNTKLMDVLFNKTFNKSPNVSLTAANANSTGLQAYVDSDSISASGFTISTTSNNLNASTTYKWYYQVIQ